MPDLSERGREWAAIALLGGLALCWILLTPPGAGADEPAHLVRSGAVIRGELAGGPADELGRESFELPDSYAVPEPACYAFEANRGISVNCAAPIEYQGDTVTLVSRADEYPIWGHVAYGVATVLPGIADVWWARLIGAAVGIALVGAAWRAAVTPLRRAGILLAMTPMVWSSFAIVNPSGFAIAGGIALWVGLWALTDIDDGVNPDWLVALGWLTLLLPRRDGILWASLIVAAVILASGRSSKVFVHRMRRGPQVVFVAAYLGPLLYALMEPSRLTIAVLASPLVIPVADRLLHTWNAAKDAPQRVEIATSAVFIAVIGCVAAARFRPGGWDTGLARTVWMNADRHLIEAIGVLGWLDTALPDVAYLAVIVGVTLLAGAAVVLFPDRAVAAGAILVGAVASAWAVEMLSGSTTGEYWQGRYSLPVLVGIPITLAYLPLMPSLTRAISDRLARTSAVLALAVTNAAAWAATRRWAVGVEGPYLPWRWRTVHEVIPAFLILGAMAAISVGLLWLVWTQPDRAAPAVTSEHDAVTP